MAWNYKTKVIREGRSWTDDDGIKHPTSWSSWSDAEKAEAGLVFTADAPPFDSRYYWDADTPKALEDVNEVDENGDPVFDDAGNQVVTKGLKSVEIDKVKAQSGSLLAPTDWYVVRKAETSEDIPTEILHHRADVRAKADASVTAIEALSSFEELLSYLAPNEETDEPAPKTDYVPPSISARQCRLVLASQGLLSAVEAAVASSAESVQIEWQFAAYISRNSALVSSLGGSLGFTSEQLDEMFKLAATL